MDTTMAAAARQKKTHVTVRYVISDALSLLGNSVASVVLPLILLARTGDPLAAGALAIITAVPSVAAGMLGGALLDRFNRRNISVISDFISAASVAALPIIDATVGLNFWWFVALGVIGSIGDVPGMTARDTLMPAVTRYDGIDLERFMGVAQSVNSLMTIVGPAAAALAMGFLGDVNALWLTAALSFVAALVTATLPHAVGVPGAGAENGEATKPLERNLVRAAWESTKKGAKVLLGGNPLLRTSIVFTVLIVMVMGGYQGLVLPVHFTETGQPELLGYVLSAMSVGVMVGSIVYAQFATKLARRTWYVLSLAGMAVGMGIMALLPEYWLLLAGAVVLGFCSGPFSALLGFKVLDLVPDEARGAAFGTQNSFLLVAAPASVFFSSVLVTALGVGMASLVVAVGWAAFTVYALVAKAMRDL